MIRFGPFQLYATQGLTRGEREVRLTPRSLQVLWHLASQAGRVVTKDELFGSVWADTAVTDAALATCIQEIRRALGDDAHRPAFIETVHRRGYRFVAATARAGAAPTPASIVQPEVPFVGRNDEIRRILATFESARGGIRQVCLVSGEPGIGKSAVLSECLGRMLQEGAITTWGHCTEQYGSGEAYQPLLDALMRLARQPQSAGTQTVAVLERFAPMWLAQLPGLLPPRQAAALQLRLVGAARERMLRELTNALEAMAAERPVVVAIEDLQWSDPSTLDWIASVAPRTDPVRLLVIATLRPRGATQRDDRLSVLVDDLRSRRLVREVALAGLGEPEVAAFVARRHPPAPGRDDELAALAVRVHRHTGGNPLFIATVLDQLVEREILRPTSDGWSVADHADAVDLGIPDSIRPVIDRQIERLSASERHLLEAASVVGEQFRVDLAAAAAGVAVDEAAESLQDGGPRRFLRDQGDPGGSAEPATVYAFAHALFREALYHGIGAGRRSALHRRVGEAQERRLGPNATDAAAELALHFALGGDDERAIRFFQQAAVNARRRSAFSEARQHYERALHLLARRPDDADRAAREVQLQLGIGAAAMATSGFGAPEVEGAYSRARELSHRIIGSPARFPALWGMWLFYWGRGEVRTAQDLAAELRELAVGADDDLRLQALHASWATAFSVGALDEARTHAAAGAEIYDVDRHAPMASTFGSHDAGVCALMFRGRAEALLGDAAAAARTGTAAIDLARSLDHPFSIALAHMFRATAAQALGDEAAARAHAEAAVAIGREQGFRLVVSWSRPVVGWADARAGAGDSGLALIDDGIQMLRASGSEQFQSYLLGLRAEACLVSDRPREGLAAISAALTASERTGEGFYVAELHRLHGDLALASGDERMARSAYRAAMDTAVSQGASVVALRAAVRLGRLDLRHGRSAALGHVRATRRAAVDQGAPIAEVAEAEELLAADEG